MARISPGRLALFVAGIFVCVLLVSAVGPATWNQGLSPVSVAGQTDETPTDEQTFDRTEFRITVHADGSATWLFRYQRTLSTTEEREDFEAYAAEFEETETDLYLDFVERSRSLVDAGSEATGREMSATDFQRAAYVTELENEGVVELGFRWDGMAVVADDAVEVGDIFEGGFYVGPDQRLVFEPGADLTFSSVDPDPDATSADTLPESSSITWTGEQSFTDERPEVVFTQVESEELEGTETPGVTPTPEPGPIEFDADGVWLVIGLVLFGVLVGVAVVAYRTERGPFAPGSTRTLDGSADDPADGGPEDGTLDSDPAPGKHTIADEEYLPDDQRVLTLLEEHGGRMRQGDIVAQTGWSKSKVSMLLSELEAADRISKLRVGRENIISLPGFEPDATNSPFDDESDE